ncbi:MAG: hypothetical protein AB1486_11680 [Planctomycetota bacterium]
MNQDADLSGDSRAGHGWLLVAPLAGVLVIAGVVVLACVGSTPQEEWDPGFGPLVPHESFPGDCTICHTTESWYPLREDFSFDHLARTGVALEGAHAQAHCLRCHNDRGPVQAYVARGCGGCHPDPHEATLGSDCKQCHSQLSWEPIGMVGQHARTRFPLSGVHLAVACDRCHLQARLGDFEGAPIECDACHQSDLARAVDPDHAANGWTSDCQRCHVPIAWEEAHFSHTTFPLTGAHAALACTACHVSGFAGTPRDCYACHETDYARTRDPDHVAAGFPTSCEQCHNTSAWTPATFPHTKFPLTGAHTSLDCSACHASGYTGTPSDCYSCHASDYTGARDPDHVANGFPTTCEQCHTTSAWRPSTFDHEAFFPIESGPHSGLDCRSCHTTGSFASFSCIDCHEHRKDKMDDEHSDVDGYRYDSNACYDCHPRGRE